MEPKVELTAVILTGAPKKFADKYKAEDDLLLKSGKEQTYEAPVKFADGTTHNVRFYKSVFKDSDGKVAGLIGIMMDLGKKEGK